MAQVTAVLVNGQVFAVCTTESNAIMLRDKINKLFVNDDGDAVASIMADGVLYNPKHVHAVERLEAMGLKRAPEQGR